MTKKIMVVSVSVFLLVLFVGCGDSQSGEKNSQGKSASTEKIDLAEYSSQELPWYDEDENFVFRRTWWGMTRAEVRDSEYGPPAEEKDRLIAYYGKIFGLSCYIGYMFTDDSLIIGRCLFNHKRVDPDDYIDDYRLIVRAMKQKYGPPVRDTTIRLKPDSTDGARTKGEALEAGTIAYFASWSVGADTRIIASLDTNRKSGDIQMGLSYSRKRLREKGPSLHIIPDTGSGR
jgi:hypothetical protein